MDEEGSREADPQTPLAEGEPSSAEEISTDPGNVGSLEGPREEGDGVQPETEEKLPGEESEVAGSKAERGKERETTPAPVLEEGKEVELGDAENESREKNNGEAKVTAKGGQEGVEGAEGGERREEVGTEGGERREEVGTEGGEVESGDEGDRKEEREGADSQQPTTQQTENTAEQQKDAKRREKERKKAEKKAKKKSKQSREEMPGSPPKLRKRTEKSEGRSRQTQAGGGQLEEILLSLFQPYDSDGNGYVEPTTFWEILQSTDLNLQLGQREVTALQEVVTPDRSGLIPYAEIAAHASDIIASLYQGQPPSEMSRVRMATPSGNRVLLYDKQTGHFQDLVEEGVNPFEENIQNLYQTADAQAKGYITREEFIALFQLEQLQLLNDEDRSQMLQYYDDMVPSGQAQYTEFYPLGKELILRLYRNQDATGSEWIHLQSDQLGRYQLNKYTGEIHRDLTATLQDSATHPQMDLINQAYRQAEEATFEKEQYKQENRDLQNQLRLTREEQETLAMQLDQTGHILDEANAEIRRKEEVLGGLQAVLTGKEHEMEELRAQLAEAELVKEKLHLLEQELESAQGEMEARDQTMVVRDSNITTLQKQSLGVVDKLKTAWATIDARDSSIVRLKYQLKTEQGKLKSYEEQTPVLEAKVAELEGEVKRTNQSLDEKTSALSTTRKHLRNSRERNMELEKEAEKVAVTQEKLRSAESEIRTLKSLLTSKTAMVERRKRDLADTRAHLLDLEEKDNRRAIILADVLERTARQYQHDILVGRAWRGTEVMTSDPQQQLSLELAIRRPVSAPSVPPDLAPASSSPPRPQQMAMGGTSPSAHPHKIVRTYTLPGGKLAPSTSTKTAHRLPARSPTVPKLPPIHRRGQPACATHSSFHVPTSNELREKQRQRDRHLVQHSESNPQCACQLCTAGGATEESIEDGVSLDEQVALAGLSGIQEHTLTQQLRTGQRVLITMKRSEFDLEPQRCTGIVKYVGKIDSEFIDNRIYVGVKLDEPVGNTDGLVKGKRYFHCPAKHGKVVRLSSVLAILPKKRVSYRPLQISKRSPYNTAPTSSHKRSVKVT